MVTMTIGAAYDAYQDIDKDGFEATSPPDMLGDRSSFDLDGPALPGHLGRVFADADAWQWEQGHSESLQALLEAHEAALHSATAIPGRRWFGRRYLLAGSESVISVCMTTSCPRITVWDQRASTPEEISGYLTHIV